MMLSFLWSRIRPCQLLMSVGLLSDLTSLLPSYLRDNDNSKFSDLILDCQFGDINCWNESYWTRLYTPQNGICFTLKDARFPRTSCRNFYADSSEEADKKQIVILAATHENDYFPMVTDHSGLRATFSQPCPSIPYAGVFGSSFNFKTGRETRATLTHHEKTRCLDVDTKERVSANQCQMPLSHTCSIVMSTIVNCGCCSATLLHCCSWAISNHFSLDFFDENRIVVCYSSHFIKRYE